jgi:hypothetical protein
MHRLQYRPITLMPMAAAAVMAMSCIGSGERLLLLLALLQQQQQQPGLLQLASLQVSRHHQGITAFG